MTESSFEGRAIASSINLACTHDTTATAANSVRPSLTALTTAVLSAHRPKLCTALSTLQPAKNSGVGTSFYKLQILPVTTVPS